MYGYEGWNMSEHMEEALRVWERKILKTVYGPKRDTNGWTICTNKELQDQNRSADMVTAINARQLELAGHVLRMDDERMVKRVFLGKPGGRRKRRRPRLRWLDCVDNGLKALGMRSWRKRAEYHEEWTIILKEAMVKLQELYAKEEEGDHKISTFASDYL
jgi:hypothetical protein